MILNNSINHIQDGKKIYINMPQILALCARHYHFAAWGKQGKDIRDFNSALTKPCPRSLWPKSSDISLSTSWGSTTELEWGRAKQHGEKDWGLNDPGSLKNGTNSPKSTRKGHGKPISTIHHHTGWFGADSVTAVCTKPPNSLCAG